MSDGLQHNGLERVMSLLEGQMRDFATVRQKQAALTGTGSAADGSVEVTVNAQQMVVKTVVDDSYLEDHELTELGDAITEAAQAASRDAQRKWSELLGPMNARRDEMRSMSAGSRDLPGYQQMMERLNELTASPPQQPKSEINDTSDFPTIKE